MSQKHKTQPQNTTHNTQCTQHTQQPTNMSRCHPTPSSFALSLSVGRAAVPPNHCTANLHHHTQVASHRACACCHWFTHLGGWNERHQIIERGGCLSLRWLLFDCYKLQSTNSWWQRWGMNWRRGKAGPEHVVGVIVPFGLSNWAMIKIREMGRPLALDGRRLMGGHSNQPKVGVNCGGGIGEETQPGKSVGGV